MAPTLVAYHGTISDINDIFVHTLAIEDEGQGAEAVAQGAVNAMTAAWEAGSPATLKASTGSNCTYTHVTAAEILDLSTGTLAASVRRDFSPAMQGSSTSNPPAQVSCAVSLTAGTYANGAPVKGRFYLPLVTVAPDTGLYSSSTVAVVANAMGVLADELVNSALVTPSVWSRKLAALQPLSLIRVGNIPDTIRSRRNSGAEVYVDVLTP